MRFLALIAALALVACQPDPVIAPRNEPPPDPEPTVEPSVAPKALVAPKPSPTLPPNVEKPVVPPPEPPEDVLIATPPAPLLTTAGRNLILEFETSGRSGYNPHPEWPHGASGVTVGIGYDLGYATPAVIESDWEALSDITVARLKKTAGLTGERAHAALPSVRDIMIEWGLATDVFDNVDVARWYANTKRAMPGFEDLRSNAKAALISLAFNRGTSMMGASRLEMRVIRDQCVPNEDYACIAKELRAMKRIWRGTVNERGLSRRRDAEAKLAETP